MTKLPSHQETFGAPIAGNGLLHRRFFLQSGAAIAAGAAATMTATGAARAESIGDDAPPWMKAPGAAFTGYGMPSHWRSDIQRLLNANPAPGREVAGGIRTPLELLEGTITPAGLHFVRNHNGTPDIDPGRHELLIHGMVRQPLIFTLDALLRYPLESHIRFVECSGNSGINIVSAEPRQDRAGALHGLLSGSEWTGVKLSALLDEAGLDPDATWILAEGADSAAMGRSVPLWKALDDAMIALYQNGEPIRPEQGFPMRLLLPGFEGNANVKWLRRLKVTDAPIHARDETSRYTDMIPGGKARQFTLQMEPKSVILKPSFGMNMQGPGTYEISGLAWSGLGRVSRVDISADSGRSWAEAALSEPVLPKALTRFRLPWMWNGQPAVLMSRTTDDKDHTQFTRAAWAAQYAPRQRYHFSGIQSWAVGPDGAVSNVYV